MFQPLRFGRRIAIPSKLQIIHEMRMLQAEEERLKAALQPSAKHTDGSDQDVHTLVPDRAAGV